MPYIYYNPNPKGLSVGDCTIRAISKVLNLSWKRTYLYLSMQGFIMNDMPSSNKVWGEFLKENGFVKFQIPDTCPDCYTIKDFCYDHPYGAYVVGTGDAVVTGVTVGTSGSALTGLGSPSTSSVLTGVKVTTQPTITLAGNATAGTGVVSVATGITSASSTQPTVTVGSNDRVTAITGIGTGTAAAQTITKGTNDQVTVLTSTTDVNVTKGN